MKLSAFVLGAVCGAVPCCAIVFHREAHVGSLSVRNSFARTAPLSVPALLELEDQLSKMAAGTGDPAADLLGEVGTLIRDTMMPGIVEAHNDTQLQLDGFGAAFDACPDPQISDDSTPLLIQTGSVSRSSMHVGVDFERRVSGEWRRRRKGSSAQSPRGGGGSRGSSACARGKCPKIDPVQPLGGGGGVIPLAATTTTTTGMIQGKFARVAECRKRQAAAAADNTKCQEDKAPLDIAKNSSCNALKQQETKPVPEDFCTPTDPYDQWLISTQGRVTELKKKLTGLKDGCGNATQLADDKKKECDATQGAVDGNKTECDQEQAEAEAAQCAEAGPDRQRCTTSETCYNNAVSAYTTQNATIVAMHLNWTVTWRVLKRMDCLLDIMAKGGTNDDIDACKAKLWDTTWLDLNYPAIPPKKECSALANLPQPGDADFAAKLYGNNPEGAPAAPATACPEPTTPPPLISTTTVEQGWVATHLAGGSGGGDFDDFSEGKRIPSRVCVWAGAHVDAIQVDYQQGGNAPKRGGNGGGQKCLDLEPDERINWALVQSGSHNPELVDLISLGTTKGRRWTVGGHGPHPAEFHGDRAEINGKAGGILCSFKGKYGGMVDALGFVWCRGYD